LETGLPATSHAPGGVLANDYRYVRGQKPDPVNLPGTNPARAKPQIFWTKSVVKRVDLRVNHHLTHAHANLRHQSPRFKELI
jgi:hypothetical protein